MPTSAFGCRRSGEKPSRCSLTAEAPTCRWFEVDQPGVLSVKHRLLARSGAKLPADTIATPPRRQDARDSRDGAQLRFPLLAASYAAAAGDLADGTWASELRAAGGRSLTLLCRLGILELQLFAVSTRSVEAGEPLLLRPCLYVRIRQHS